MNWKVKFFFMKGQKLQWLYQWIDIRGNASVGIDYNECNTNNRTIGLKCIKLGKLSTII